MAVAAADGDGFQAGQQTVDFSLLVRKTTEASFTALKQLCEDCPDQSDTQKKLLLLKFIAKTRQRLLRLLVLSKWCSQIRLVECCQQLLGTLSNHDTSFTQAADSLFYLHEGLQQARAPLYDIASAVEVLLTGSYERLPKCIDDLRMQPVLEEEENNTTLQKLDTLLRSQLLDISLPKESCNITVADGRVKFSVEGEFAAHLTLGYCGNPLLWRVLHLDLLVGESTGKLKLTDLQEGTLKDDLERRMSASENPFETLHSVLHEFCIALVMDTVIRQVRAMRAGRWKDAIRFEIVSDGSVGQAGNIMTGHNLVPASEGDVELGTVRSQSPPGLKIMYWLDVYKAGDATLLPSLKIELESDNHITCSHQPPVFDPVTQLEAEFVLDQGCIDIEKLLLRAICCNIHTRLLDIERGLKSSSQLYQSESDVLLKLPVIDFNRLAQQGDDTVADIPVGDIGEAGGEIICVRAYGQSYMALGINIRNGKFMLRSACTLVSSASLTEMEEALNQGLVSPLEVFVNLRIKSILSFIATIGTSLKLKVYEKGAVALKVPTDSLKLNSDALIMGFPSCESAYIISIQLDNNFMPLFNLIEGQIQTSNGQSPVLAGSVRVLRFTKIDIEPLLVGEDEVNLSLFNEGNLEFQTKELFADADYLKKETSVSVMASAGEKGFHAKESSGYEIGSLAEKIFAAERDLYSSVQPYKHISIASPQNNQATGSGGQLGQTAHVLNINTFLHNISAGKASPNASNSSGRSVSEGNPRGVRHLPIVGLPISSRTSVISPSKIPTLQKLTAGMRTFFPSEVDQCLAKSPLNLGDSATSPINLDDDDLSKLIDSISSKTTVTPLLNTSALDDNVPLASPFRPHKASTPYHSSATQRSSVPAVHSPFPKGSSMQPNYIVRTPLQSVSPSTHTTSPGRISPIHENLNARTDGISLLSESSEMSETLHSTSLVLTSPTRTPALLASGQHVPGSSPQQNLSLEKRNKDSTKRKRIGPELLASLPSLQGNPSVIRNVKRRKLDYEASQFLNQDSAYSSTCTSLLEYFKGKSYACVVAAVNQGRAPISAYTAVLLHVIRRCLISIKHARLTRQMDLLGIPYVEEVGLRKASTNLWFRLPAMTLSKEGAWKDVCLYLGKPGIAGWEVKIYDEHFKRLWELQKHNSMPYWGANVQVVTSEADSHMQCTPEGLILSYMSVQNDSIKKVLADLERLWHARTFALGIKRLLESKMEDKAEVVLQGQGKGETGEKPTEIMRRAFRIEAIGLTSVWFCYTGSGSLQYAIARFVIEWETGKKGCTMHVSPEQLWPHTKYLEDYINGGEVELLLDCIRVTAGPLHALAGAIRPARMTSPPNTLPYGGVSANVTSKVSTGALLGHVLSPNSNSAASPGNSGRVLSVNATTAPVVSSTTAAQAGQIISGPGRGTGLAPSSLLPTDVSVVLRSPYWVRIIYRRQFAVDMRCFAGDHVWLQPAPPPRGCVQGIKGSLPCPQFRPFVMEQITTGFNNAEASGVSNPSTLTSHANQPSTAGVVGGSMPSPGPASVGSAIRASAGLVGATRQVQSSSAQAGGPNRVVGAGGGVNAHGLVPSNALGAGRSLVPGVSFHPSYRELNAGGYGFSEDGGYGGVWVSLAPLKKVLRGTLRYLGVVWLFTQFPSIIREVLDTHLKENEGALLHHEPETPALRFYIQNCVFAVSVHRQQLVLQAINVKRYQQHQTPQQQQQQQQQSQVSGSDSDLSLVEMQEIGDFFARRAAFEPYDASRLASFVTMLTLPVPVLREFVGLIAWKKDFNKVAQQGQLGDLSQCPRPRIELCLESRTGLSTDANVPEENSSVCLVANGPKGSIHYDRPRSTVDFTLTLILDSANVPHVSIAGGAGWLPQCVAVRLRYAFGEGNCISLLSMEGSHGGRACWSGLEDWERCKEMVTRAVEMCGGGNVAEQGQGRLRAVAEVVQMALQSALQQLCKGSTNSPSMGVSL